MTKVAKTGKNNLAGCLLGCLGIAVLIVVLISGGLFYSFRYGKFAAAPKIETTSLVSAGAALSVRVDFQAPTAITLAQIEGSNAPQLGALAKMFFPYEGALALSVSPDGREVYASAAVSSPRGATFAKQMLEGIRPDLESNGRTLTRLEVDPEHAGVLALRMLLPSPEEAPGLRKEAWNAPMPGDAPALSGHHFFECVLDNRNGDGGLAFAALAQTMGEGKAPTAAPPVALSLLSQVRLIKGSRLVSTLSTTADFTATGDLDIATELHAANEVSAMLLMSSLGDLPEKLAQDWEGAGIVVTGNFERSGAQIKGSLHFDGVVPRMRAAMQAYNERGGIAGLAEGEKAMPFTGFETLKP